MVVNFVGYIYKQNSCKISHDGWDRLFSIKETTYKKLTLEVLSIVEVMKHCLFTHQPSYISFRTFGKKHRVTQDYLGVLLGFYTEAYTHTPEFKNLSQDSSYPVTSEKYSTFIATSWRIMKET